MKSLSSSLSLLLVFCTAIAFIANASHATGMDESLRNQHPKAAALVDKLSHESARSVANNLILNNAVNRLKAREDPIEKLIQEAIENTIIGIMDGLNISAIEIAIAGMDLPEIYVNLSTPLLNVTLGIETANYTEIDVQLNAPYELFDVSLNAETMPMDVALNSPKIPMDVVLNSNEMPMNVTIDSNQLPMNITMASNDMPLNVVMHGKEMPMQVKLDTQDMPITVQMDSFEVGFVSWIMLGFLLLFQLILCVLIVMQHRKIQSMWALAESLKSNSSQHSFCTECGARNGTSAKYCCQCGTKMIRTSVSVIPQNITTYGSTQYTDIDEVKN